MIRGELFFFKSQYVWRLRERQLQIGYPALASRHWKSFPDHVDAAYEDKSGNIWFFQGWQKKIQSGLWRTQKCGIRVSIFGYKLQWFKINLKSHLFGTQVVW